MFHAKREYLPTSNKPPAIKQRINQSINRYIVDPFQSFQQSINQSMSAVLKKRTASPNTQNERESLISNNSIDQTINQSTDQPISQSTSQSIDESKKLTAWDELPNIILLICLYALQGVPLGLTFGSIPFLLQSSSINQSIDDNVYTKLGWFSLASWPYSLKLLWSPIVDTYYLPSMGRRKSWIVPMQLLIGVMLIALSQSIDRLIDEGDITHLTSIFFLLIVCVATQDIAVDGWAISLLPEELLSYASTCQSIGQNLGYFLSYSVFLALNNPSFSNTIRPLIGYPLNNEFGFVSLSSYMWFWGVAFLACTFYLWIVKRENPYVLAKGEDSSLLSLYSRIWRVLQLPNVRFLCVVLLTSRVAFVASDNITVLKLTEYGFPKEHLAMMVFGLFPFELIFPVIVGRWSASGNPLAPFLAGYPMRMILTLAGMCIVASFPTGQSISWTFYLSIFILQLGYQLSVNVLFVSQCAFFSQVSDPRIGGTYMTLLNTVSNLGNTWPKFGVFFLVDRLTCHENAKCHWIPKGTDGYYPVMIGCFVIGVVWLTVMRKQILKLGATPKEEWRCD